MSPKSIAFLVVGMLVISSVFFVFHVTYPNSPATITLKNPKTPKNVTPPNYQIFNNQTLNLPKLGLNQTSFTPSGNATLTLSGYVYNNSDPKQVLANQNLGIAVMQAFTMVKTNSQGYYQVVLKASGQGTFAFKAFQYATRLYQLYISPGTSSLAKNLYLSPMQKFQVSGHTESHGNDISGVDLSFQSFWGSYSSVSSSTGSYTVNMVDQNYSIFAQKTGFSNIPDPTSVGVNNTPQSSFNILLNSSNQAILYMSGYVHNALGAPVSNADLSVISPQLSNSLVQTFANGYYNISVAYYSNTIQISATGYTLHTQTVYVTHNLTNQNFTISSFNPFFTQKYTGSISPGPYGMSNNSSIVNYGSNQKATINGTVYNNQTGMKVANQQFVVYTSVNGTYFYYNIGSGSNGSYAISMAYLGDYNYSIRSTNFNPAWMDQILTGNAPDVTIWVTTAQSNIYNINGSLLNKLTGGNITNATINITGSGGQLLKQIHVGANGSYNFTLIGGSYNMTVSAPGFNTTTSPINVNNNYTKNLTLAPSTGISPGSTTWSSSNGSGLPGVNSTGITGQINATMNTSGAPTTTSGSPVNLSLQFNDTSNGQSIANTPYLIYINVNGLYLRISGSTNSTGGSTLYLAYGGTFILLPEMIDYSGSAIFVNTSQVSGPVVFNMTPLQQYTLQVNLTNPLSYTGSTVPVGSLSANGSYALPIFYSTYHEASNYTIVNYSLPDGTYNFQYSNQSYVPISFTSLLNGSSVKVDKVLKPYVLDLSWSTETVWGYYLNSTSRNIITSLSDPAGSGSIIYGLTAGTFNFQSVVGSTKANSSSFTLTTSAWQKSLTLNILGNTLNLTKYVQPAYVTQSSGSFSTVYNYSVPSSVLVGNPSYIDQFILNITTSDHVTVKINGIVVNGSPANGAYTLSNYFALKHTTATAISITADGITLGQFASILNSVNMIYYNVTLR